MVAFVSSFVLKSFQVIKPSMKGPPSPLPSPSPPPPPPPGGRKSHCRLGARGPSVATNLSQAWKRANLTNFQEKAANLSSRFDGMDSYHGLAGRAVRSSLDEYRDQLYRSKRTNSMRPHGELGKANAGRDGDVVMPHPERLGTGRLPFGARRCFSGSL
jgi:hypothetical protein